MLPNKVLYLLKLANCGNETNSHFMQINMNNMISSTIN